MRTLAIGDVHGCNTALANLLKQAKPAPDDKLIFLGDYIDRGPASREAIETLLELKKSHPTVFLRGNHEEMILDARADFLNNCSWQTYGGVETLSSYGTNHREDWISRIPASHWEFFEQTANFHETANDIFVHACLDPELTMEDQPDGIFYWESFGRMKQQHISGKRVICGHTVQKSGQPANAGFAICIDTGAAYGGWLTCLDCDSGEYWQANEKGDTRAGKL